jgi:hypothetical protein
VLRLIAMTILLADLLLSSSAPAQTVPASPEHPWHGPDLDMQAYAKNVTDSRFTLDQSKTYSLVELIDLAEAHNPANSRRMGACSLSGGGFGDYSK